MSEEKKQSFTQLVTKFLRSSQSDKYNLNPYHREILRVIALYLDMPYGSCFAKQVTLAKECGMSLRQFKYKSEELVLAKLLDRTKCRKLYHYELSTLRCTLCT